MVFANVTILSRRSDVKKWLFLSAAMAATVLSMTMVAVAGYAIALKINEFMKSLVYCAAGVLGTLILTRTLGSLVEGIGTNDAVSFVAASLLFGGVAAVACSIPARKASRVDPMVALRHG